MAYYNYPHMEWKASSSPQHLASHLIRQLQFWCELVSEWVWCGVCVSEYVCVCISKRLNLQLLFRLHLDHAHHPLKTFSASLRFSISLSCFSLSLASSSFLFARAFSLSAISFSCFQSRKVWTEVADHKERFTCSVYWFEYRLYAMHIDLTI